MLEDANLQYSNFEGANFAGANLVAADLKNSVFDGAYFFMATLEDTNFSGSSLDGADLTGANLSGTEITKEQRKSADGKGVPKAARLADLPSAAVPSLLSKIAFKIDVEVKETPENRDKIIARLEQLSTDVANLAGISKEETPAKTILAAIEAGDLTPQIMELVSDAVLDCADME